MQETKEMWVQSQVRKIPWRRAWQPTPVFLPGESHRQRRLVGYSPWGPQKVRHCLYLRAVFPKVLCQQVLIRFRFCQWDALGIWTAQGLCHSTSCRHCTHDINLCSEAKDCSWQALASKLQGGCDIRHGFLSFPAISDLWVQWLPDIRSTADAELPESCRGSPSTFTRPLLPKPLCASNFMGSISFFWLYLESSLFPSLNPEMLFVLLNLLRKKKKPPLMFNNNTSEQKVIINTRHLG